MFRNLQYRLPGLVLRAFIAFVMLFVTLPLLIIVAVSFTPEQFLNFPPNGFSTKWYGKLLGTPSWVTAMKQSALVALGATAVGTSIGGSLGYALDRYDFRVASVLQTMGIVPILLPPITIGVAFFSFFVTIGFSGTIWNLIIAHGIFFSPFPFLLVIQGLDELDRSYEEAALDLGSTPLETFHRVTFPLIRSNIFAGAIFVFILSLNEYIVAWIISGFVIQTVPIKIFTALRYSFSPVIAAVSVFFILITVVVITVIDVLSGGVWE